MDSVLFSAVQLWINCTAFSQSNLRNFAEHVIMYVITQLDTYENNNASLNDCSYRTGFNISIADRLSCLSFTYKKYHH